MGRLTGGLLTPPPDPRNAPASAAVMATRGFTPKTAPLKKLWINAGVSGHGILSSGASGSAFALNDTTDYCLGSQSIALTTNGTGTSGYCQVFKTAMPAIDTTGSHVRIWVKVDDVSKTRQLTLHLGDDTFANYFQCQFFTTVGQTPYEAKANIKSGIWTPIDIAWSDFVAQGLVGTPTRSAITAFRFQVQDNGGSVPCTVHFGGIGGVAPSDRYPTGAVSLTFDDSFLSTYTIARAYMDRYGFAGTLYPILERLDLPQASGYLTTALARRLLGENGWDFGHHATTVASHGTGFDNMTEAQLVTEFETIRAWAKANDVRGDSFAWPLTTSSALAEKVAANYFRTGRGGALRTMETLPPPLPYRLRSFGMNAAATLAAAQAAVDIARNGPAWTIFTFHDIKASGATGNDCTTANFQSLMDYINTSGVQVATVSQVMDRV